jgi:hypothetical protein
MKQQKVYASLNPILNKSLYDILYGKWEVHFTYSLSAAYRMHWFSQGRVFLQLLELNWLLFKSDSQ